MYGWHTSLQDRITSWDLKFIENLYTFYDIKSRFREGIEVFDNAISMLRSKPNFPSDQEQIGILLAKKGSFCGQIGHYDEAMSLFEESEQLLESTKSWQHLGTTCNNIGLVHIFRGNFDEALNYFKKSLAIADEFGDTLAVARVLNNMGILHNRQDNLVGAIEHFQQCLRIYRQVGDKRLIAYVLNNLGNAATKSGDFEYAGKLYEESFQIKVDLGNQWGAACTLINLGEIALQKQFAEEAYIYFSKSQEICHSIGKRRSILRLNIFLAKTTMILQRYVECGNYLIEAIQLAFEFEDYPKVLDIMAMIAKFYLLRDLESDAILLLNLVAQDHRTSGSTMEVVQDTLSSLNLTPASTQLTLDSVRQEVVDYLYRPEKPLLHHLLRES